MPMRLSTLGRQLGRLKYDVAMVELIKEGVVEGIELVTVTLRGCQAEEEMTAANPIKVFSSCWAGSRQVGSNHVAAGIRNGRKSRSRRLFFAV